MGSEGQTDEELLAAADAASFGVFYARNVSVVLVYVRRRTPRAEVAFDVVAETFARALAGREHFDPSKGSAVGWILRIARNIIVDAVRRGRVDAEARAILEMEPVNLDDSRIAAIDARAGIDIDELLEGLPDLHREAIERRILEDESYGTIAESIGCSEQVVRQRVSRGLALLRRTLEQQR